MRLAVFLLSLACLPQATSAGEDLHDRVEHGYAENDGVRIHLGRARVHDDPKVGKDRTRESKPIEITRPGWYRLEIWYFEKRNTSTLEVKWKTPGSERFTSIPAADLKHL